MFGKNMSRIGEAPITIPQAVEVKLEGEKLLVTGPKGSLNLILRPEVKVEINNGIILVKRQKDDKFSHAVHGLMRALINNMVKGVTEGWSKTLELVGVGYRASGEGDNLSLSVGYSHPVNISAPEGINFVVTDQTKIVISGIDKELVGQIAANIRGVKPPEVYKGKGIRYSGEYVRKKPGKAGKAIVGGAAAK